MDVVNKQNMTNDTLRTPSRAVEALVGSSSIKRLNAFRASVKLPMARCALARRVYAFMERISENFF